MYDANLYLPDAIPVLLLVGLFTLTNSHVQAEPRADTSPDELVTFSVHADETEVSAGETLMLYFYARMKPEWHIYWKNPGETGMATDISLKAPDGFDVKDIQWPRPVTFKTGDIISYGYKEETVLSVPVRVPEDLSDRPHEFQATVTSLVCRDKCLMQNQEMSFSLKEVEQPGASLREKIRSFRKAIPEPFSSLEDTRVTWKKGSVIFSGPRGNAKDIRFYPIAIPGVELGSASVELDDRRFTVRVPVKWHPENHIGNEKPAVKGVIGMGDGPTDPGYHVSVPLNMDQVRE